MLLTGKLWKSLDIDTIGQLKFLSTSGKTKSDSKVLVTSENFNLCQYYHSPKKSDWFLTVFCIDCYPVYIR